MTSEIREEVSRRNKVNVGKGALAWGGGMLKKYVSKFAMDIFPSVAATIIGAYIVNHYIAKPASDPPAASATSPAQARKAEQAVPGSAKSPESTSAVARRSDSSAAEAAPAGANIPTPGVTAKGISEKAIAEKSAAERSPVEKPGATSADTPTEAASISAETRRRPPPARERVIAKPVAPPVQSTAPVEAVPNTTPTLEAAPVQHEERPDAAHLARAALARLRPRAQEASRGPVGVPSIADQSSPVLAAPVAPLPPPIVVSTPAGENDAQAGSSQIARPDFTRPTPPADIPVAGAAARPLDLHAEVMEQGTHERTTVAEDVLSAAKSVFNAVLPKSQN